MFGLNSLLGLANGIGQSGAMEGEFGEQLSQMASGLLPLNNVTKHLPPTAGLNMVGGPMSGIGILGQLLGGKGGAGGGTVPPQQTAGPGGIAGPVNPGQNPIPGMPNPEADGVTVTGDGWKPRGQTILGAIADGFLMSQGKQPMFSIMRDRRNVNEAMSDFTSDPQAAIRRMSRIPGKEQDAWNLYDKYQDNQRADMAAGSLADSRKEKYLTRIGGMLRAAQKAPDPIAAYRGAMGYIKNYAQTRGLEEDIADLPSEYDETAVNNWVMGGVSPEDQYKQEALDAHRAAQRALQERKADDMQGYRIERLEDFDNAQATRDRTAARQDAKAGGGSGNPLVRDPNGNVVGMVDKTGKVAKLKAPDGGEQFFEVLPNGKLGQRIPNELIKLKGK